MEPASSLWFTRTSSWCFWLQLTRRRRRSHWLHLSLFILTLFSSDFYSFAYCSLVFCCVSEYYHISIFLYLLLVKALISINSKSLYFVLFWSISTSLSFSFFNFAFNVFSETFFKHFCVHGYSYYIINVWTDIFSYVLIIFFPPLIQRMSCCSRKLMFMTPPSVLHLLWTSCVCWCWIPPPALSLALHQWIHLLLPPSPPQCPDLMFGGWFGSIQLFFL